MIKRLKGNYISKKAGTFLQKRYEPHMYNEILKRMAGWSKAAQIAPLQDTDGVLVTDDSNKGDVITGTLLPNTATQ